MNKEELINQTIKYFGSKNKKQLKKIITSFELENKETQRWKKIIKKVTNHPLIIYSGMYDYVVENIKNKNFKEIEIGDIGDLSWNIKILLSKNINKGYDWDKNLAIKCGGTARILEIYINFLIPAYTFNTFYMTYSKENNFYEFGKIILNNYENQIIKSLKGLFKELNYFYVNQKLASMKFPELISDIHYEGNASIFDCLFTDVHFYQGNTTKFNDETLKDPTGKTINWKEYYNKGKLLFREEFTYFESKNVLNTITNNKGEIIKVNVWRDIGKFKHKKFTLNINNKIKKVRRTTSV